MFQPDAIKRIANYISAGEIANVLTATGILLTF